MVHVGTDDNIILAVKICSCLIDILACVMWQYSEYLNISKNVGDSKPIFRKYSCTDCFVVPSSFFSPARAPARRVARVLTMLLGIGMCCGLLFTELVFLVLYVLTAPALTLSSGPHILLHLYLIYTGYTALGVLLSSLSPFLREVCNLLLKFKFKSTSS